MKVLSGVAYREEGSKNAAVDEEAAAVMLPPLALAAIVAMLVEAVGPAARAIVEAAPVWRIGANWRSPHPAQSRQSSVDAAL